MTATPREALALLEALVDEPSRPLSDATLTKLVDALDTLCWALDVVDALAQLAEVSPFALDRNVRARASFRAMAASKGIADLAPGPDGGWSYEARRSTR